MLIEKERLYSGSTGVTISNLTIPKTITVDNMTSYNTCFNNNQICDTCIKSDVCMLSEDFKKAIARVGDAIGDMNNIIEVDIKCTKWARKTESVYDPTATYTRSFASNNINEQKGKRNG